MKSMTVIEPRYQETDQMGVIHHSVYPVWYEVGRTRYLEDCGTSYLEITKQGLHMALTDLYVNYKRPVKFGSKVFLYTEIMEVTKLRVKIAYEIYNEQDELVNQGYTTHAWLDQNLKLTNIEKSHKALYTLFMSFLEKEKA